MRRPKYALEQELFYCAQGEFGRLIVDTITVAPFGIRPFTDEEFHNSIFYIDKNGNPAPESVCFDNKHDAVVHQIHLLQKELDE